MGRVFTTMFEFKGEQHVAVVTVCEEQPGQTDYKVRLMNKEFYHFIPEGIINFTSNDSSLPHSIQTQVAAELFLSVKTAIRDYLSQSTTVSK